MSEEGEPQLDPGNAAERRTLEQVLAINATQFLVAGTVGLYAQSTGLLGAALDNLGDALVYAVSLYAVGRGVLAKARVARISGYFLVFLSVALFAEVIRRFNAGSEPIGPAMIVTALINSATNMWSLRLLRAHREEGVHMKASWIFTTNDMISNLAIAASGVAVMLFGSPLPDLIIGLIVSVIVARGGWQILGEAREARAASER